MSTSWTMLLVPMKGTEGGWELAIVCHCCNSYEYIFYCCERAAKHFMWQYVSSLVCAFDFGMRHIGYATGQKVTQTATAQGSIPANDGIPDWRLVDEVARWVWMSS